MQKAALVVSGVFLLTGILGFTPGVFSVSLLHNVVHLAFGAVGLAMCGTHARARAYLIGGGLIYLVSCIYGSMIDRESAIAFVPVSIGDYCLHFGWAATMIALGVVLDGARSLSEPPGRPRVTFQTPPP